MVQQQASETETELLSFLFQAVNALGILASGLFQAAI